MNAAHEKLLTRIAKEELDIDTLEHRNLDALDFYDLGVGSIRRALEAAFKAGMAAEAARAQRQAKKAG